MLKNPDGAIDDGPATFLELNECLQFDCGDVPLLRVGTAPELPRRPEKRNTRMHSQAQSVTEGWNVVKAAVQDGVQSADRKRSRKAGKSNLDCIILNSSGKPQLLAALEINQGARIIICQEHHCSDTHFVDLQHDAKKLGWTLTGAPAKRTVRDGTSAGVAVAVKSGIPVGDIGGTVDLSPSESLGRLFGAWVQVGPDTGMLFLSIYLYHTEGATMRNKNILKRAFSIVSSYGSPRLIAGDFNADPETILAQCASSLERANSYVMATGDPTHCPTTGTQRTIDYAICSEHLRGWIVGMRGDHGFEAAPHRAVCLSIEAAPHNHLVEVLSGPRQLPRQRPIGC